MSDERLHHADRHPGRLIELALTLLETRFRNGATAQELRRDLGTLACWLSHFAPRSSRYLAQAILAHFYREQN